MRTLPENSPIFSELQDGDMAKLVAAGTVQDFPAGVDVAREKSALESVFVVLAGRLHVLVGASGTKLAELRPGELVGEMSFVDNRPSSAEVRAMEPSKLLVIPKKKLEEILAADPGMAARLYRGIACLVVRRLRSTIQQLGYGDKEAAPIEVQVDKRLLDRVK